MTVNLFVAQFADAVPLVATSTAFGPGNGEIFLEGVSCRGNETNLDDCPLNGVVVSIDNYHYCSHSSDGGVICPQGVFTYCRCSFNVVCAHMSI